MDCHDCNLILMLDLRRFGRRNWSRHVSGASFSCLLCTTWTQVSGDQFLVPETWAENLGRVPSTLQSVNASACRTLSDDVPCNYTGCLFQSVSSSSCVLTYRCLHGLGPDYFSNEFTRVSDLRPRQRLRSASTAALIVLATRHSTLGDRAFPVIGARLLNSLPDDITTATSLLTFRHKLKTFLFCRSHDNVDS